jgi:hypothetical protein
MLNRFESDHSGSGRGSHHPESLSTFTLTNSSQG